MGETFVLRLADQAGIAADAPDRFVELGAAFGWRWTTDLQQAELFTVERAEAFRDQGGLLAGCELVRVSITDEGVVL